MMSKIKFINNIKINLLGIFQCLIFIIQLFVIPRKKDKLCLCLKMFCLVDKHTHHLQRDKLEIKCWMLGDHKIILNTDG